MPVKMKKGKVFCDLYDTYTALIALGMASGMAGAALLADADPVGCLVIFVIFWACWPVANLIVDTYTRWRESHRHFIGIAVTYAHTERTFFLLVPHADWRRIKSQGMTAVNDYLYAQLRGQI